MIHHHRILVGEKFSDLKNGELIADFRHGIEIVEMVIKFHILILIDRTGKVNEIFENNI